LVCSSLEGCKFAEGDFPRLLMAIVDVGC